jgi:pyruvate formate lyase activating enzyme
MVALDVTVRDDAREEGTQLDALAVEEALVADIQRFSLHDGPGIRTTVFLKGCVLRCLWCQNPEAVGTAPEMAFFAERCEAAGRCADVCPEAAISFAGDLRIDFDRCTACGACAEACPHGAIRLVGRRMGLDDLERELLKDRGYFEASGGGVTFSGGEPMVHASFLAQLFPRLARRGVHIAIETCGAFPWSRMEALLPSLDLVYFDLKHLDSDVHRRLAGLRNDLILANFARLAASNVRVVPRMPVVPGCNDDVANVRATARFLREHGHFSLQLLAYHHLGEAKKPRLGAPLAPFELPSLEPDELEAFAALFEEEGIHAVVAR